MINRKDKNLKKRMVPTFYNAFTLWLTSMFAIPLSVSIFFGLLAYPHLTAQELDYLVLFLSILALIPGTAYACKFINSKYYIKNKSKVIYYSVLVALAAYILFVGLQSSTLRAGEGVGFIEILNSKMFYVSLFGYLSKIGVFYLTAKSKLKQD